jgi:hypothetical protein
MLVFTATHPPVTFRTLTGEGERPRPRCTSAGWLVRLQSTANTQDEHSIFIWFPRNKLDRIQAQTDLRNRARHKTIGPVWQFTFLQLILLHNDYTMNHRKLQFSDWYEHFHSISNPATMHLCGAVTPKANFLYQLVEVGCR